MGKQMSVGVMKIFVGRIIDVGCRKDGASRHPRALDPPEKRRAAWGLLAAGRVVTARRPDLVTIRRELNFATDRTLE